MTLHTYTCQSMSLPSIKFLHIMVCEIQSRQDPLTDILKVKAATAR